nr:T9SS type A sorting domain-containing protein [uncultured Psychroserpens sp.]
MKNYLLLITLFTLSTLYAQSGNTIENAIEVNGTLSSVSTFGNDITDSQLAPTCISSEDIFYKHTVQTGDNKMTIGMTSAAISAIADVNYQIFVAPEGDMNQLSQLQCDYYTVLILVGGSFQFVIDDVSLTNSYYLRVYKSTDAGASLADLMNNTTITMMSEFDATLSNPEVATNDFNYKVTNDNIILQNNTNVSNYKIYGLEGKLIKNSNTDDNIEYIDISTLSNGIYVLNLVNNNHNKSYKFIKH